MQVLYGYSPLNGGRTRTLPGSESQWPHCDIITLLGFKIQKEIETISWKQKQ